MNASSEVLNGLAPLNCDPIFRRYLNGFQVVVEALDLAAISKATEMLRTAREAGRFIYFAGNGGSAATATHMANDLSKATLRSGRKAMKVLSLSDNVSWFSALANDEGYDRVFSGQLENLSQAGDVLVVISASGNSMNLVKAVEHAKSRGVSTVGFLGFDGGALMSMVDCAILTATAKGEYGIVETAHTLVGDLITTCLIEDKAS
jgi:D-sedoheptulose 7-phosphate isomerase